MRLLERLRIRSRRRASACPEGHADLAAKVTYCDVCGYDLVTRTRDETLARRGPR